jgi:hypothetical protein
MDSRPTKPRGKCKRRNPKTSPLYVFSTTIGPALEGLSPLPFHARDLMFIPCVRGGSQITFTTLDLDTPYLRLQCLI